MSEQIPHLVEGDVIRLEIPSHDIFGDFVVTDVSGSTLAVEPVASEQDYEPSEAELIAYFHSGGGEDPVSAATAAATKAGVVNTEPIDVVFDGPPGPECACFIDCEDAEGRSVRVGRWIDRGDGYWVLRFNIPANEVGR